MGKGGCAHPPSPGLGARTLSGFTQKFLSSIAGSFSNLSDALRPETVSTNRYCLNADPTRRWSLEEVEKHASRDSCWVIVKGKVYDVTAFAAEHPGGPVIYTQGGKDATDVFSTFHSPSTWSFLQQFQVGVLDVSVNESQLVRDFRELRVRLLQQGMFQSSKSYYAMKVAVNLALLLSAIALLFMWPSSWLTLVSSAFILALCWQQMGWLSHDFLHHQVFLNRGLNTNFGYFLGNIVQGFSVDWWKRKHNTHHAAPNEITIDNQPVDPDIDTLPLLAWSDDIMKNVQDPSTKALLRWQHWFFVPLLLVARFAWAKSSFTHAWRLFSKQGKIQEVALLCLHYAWYLGVAFGALGVIRGAIYAMLVQVFCGFMLSLVFVQSHNGMEVYKDVKDFWTAQIVTTRDIYSNLWNDWFTGGLNLQIEHHLFPTMPRHNLKKVVPMVMELCYKHGLVYESCSMPVGTYKVIKHLAQVAAQA